MTPWRLVWGFHLVSFATGKLWHHQAGGRWQVSQRRNPSSPHWMPSRSHPTVLPRGRDFEASRPCCRYMSVARFGALLPIKDGLQQYGEGCAGSPVQVSQEIWASWNTFEFVGGSRCACFFFFVRGGGPPPPDFCTAEVAPRNRQSGTGSVVIDAMLPLRHCLKAQQKQKTKHSQRDMMWALSEQFFRSPSLGWQT